MAIRGLKAASSLGYLLFATVSSAQDARIDARQFTCQQARSPVIQQGAIVLTSSNTTYDRIVRYGSFCDPGYSSRLFSLQRLTWPAALSAINAFHPMRFRCSISEAIAGEFHDTA